MDEMLSFAIKNGMIDLSDVRQRMLEMEKKSYLEKHQYKIYEGKDGYWYTYLPGEMNRRKIKRRTKDEIEAVVVEYYKKESENPTVKDIFETWNDRRLALGKIKKSTHSRNVSLFKQHFGEFGLRHIKSIAPGDVCDFLEEEIARCHLTSKAFLNLKGVMRGVLKRAKKEGYITFPVEQTLVELDVSERQFKKTFTTTAAKSFTTMK